MGLYPIDCPSCKKAHMWFSGNMDQRCYDCKTFVPPGPLLDSLVEKYVYKSSAQPFCWSTNLLYAWDLLQFNHEYVDVRYHAVEKGREWTVYMKTPKKDGVVGTEASGETAAHAICLCALRAVGWYGQL